MKNRLFAGIMLAATLTSLASCTQSTPSPIAPETTSGTTTTSEVPTLPISSEVTLPSVNTGATSSTQTGTISYSTPGGVDKVNFSLTHKSGIVESLTVTPAAENDISKMWQAKFAESVSSEIVGKNIKDLKLSAIGGASLTTGAFNQFIASL
jgi:hypothetical protein